MTAPSDPSSLIVELRALLRASRATAARQVNALVVLTNYEIGRRLVDHEQAGETRAEYGKGVMKEVSAQLTAEFGRGYSVENLTLMRRFYVTYAGRLRISQTPSTNSETPSQLSAPSATPPFTLTWSHYVFLLGVNDPAERAFYEVEATNQGWSLRELRRQFDTSLYERLALSRDKEAIRALSVEGQVVARPEDVLKDPYVLDFLGLDSQPNYSESDLEAGLIDKLEQFLLELGKGFLFEGRQRRFSFDEEHFYVDLVFYNRLLRCFVIVDLKIGTLTHQDLGQMQMYVNYYDRHVKLPEEAPTIGIILCKRNREALVEITLPEDANIHAREYSLFLPSKDDLKRKLLEWTGEE